VRFPPVEVLAPDTSSFGRIQQVQGHIARAKQLEGKQNPQEQQRHLEEALKVPCAATHHACNEQHLEETLEVCTSSQCSVGQRG